MKQIQVCTLAAAALALLACGKTPNTPVEPGKDINSVEIENESVPVPIELGSGTATKAAMINAVNFPSTKFGVLAIDENAGANDANKVLLNGVEAGNVQPDDKDYYVTKFFDNEANETDYYYPLISKNNYTFFGYRTNEDGTYTLDEGYNAANIALGYSDIIWAKAEAPTLPAPYASLSGFNAKYIRAIKALAGNNGDYLAGDYAPKLRFNHITSALSFNIKAADEAAEESLNGIATLTGITLTNVKTTANLAVLTGELSTNTNAVAGELVVKKTDGTAPDAAAFDEDGAIFGAPLFILPSLIDDPYEDNGAGYSVVLSLLVNGQPMVLDPIKLTEPNNGDNENPDYGFKAGKHYTFTISINSLEEIVIVTELTPWADGGSTEEIVIE